MKRCITNKDTVSVVPLPVSPTHDRERNNSSTTTRTRIQCVQSNNSNKKTPNTSCCNQSYKVKVLPHLVARMRPSTAASLSLFQESSSIQGSGTVEKVTKSKCSNQQGKVKRTNTSSSLRTQTKTLEPIKDVNTSFNNVTEVNRNNSINMIRPQTAPLKQTTSQRKCNFGSSVPNHCHSSDANEMTTRRESFHDKQDAKHRRRCEVYAINKVMKNAFQREFNERIEICKKSIELSNRGKL